MLLAHSDQVFAFIQERAKFDGIKNQSPSEDEIGAKEDIVMSLEK